MSRGQPSSNPRIVAETRLVPGNAIGVQLQLINKRPDGLQQFLPGRTLVMMHGATFPSASLFDVAVDGASVMDLLAMAGYDVWAVDARGYGGSSCSREMAQTPEGAPPLTPARTAVGDFDTAAGTILGARENPKTSHLRNAAEIRGDSPIDVRVLTFPVVSSFQQGCHI